MESLVTAAAVLLVHSFKLARVHSFKLEDLDLQFRGLRPLVLFWHRVLVLMLTRSFVLFHDVLLLEQICTPSLSFVGLFVVSVGRLLRMMILFVSHVQTLRIRCSLLSLKDTTNSEFIHPRIQVCSFSNRYVSTSVCHSSNKDHG